MVGIGLDEGQGPEENQFRLRPTNQPNLCLQGMLLSKKILQNTLKVYQFCKILCSNSLEFRKIVILNLFLYW
jgi:hypothetical protein